MDFSLNAQERLELLDFLRTLIRTPSFPGQEGAVAALVMQEMQRLGFEQVSMDRAGNVIGSIGPEEGPLLMFNAHMDTVTVSQAVAWQTDPFGAEVRDGLLYGLGSCDMKAGLAAALYAIAGLRKQGIPLRGRVMLAAVGLEEPAEGTGTRVLFEEDHLHPDWVVIAEPSALQVVRAQRGHVELLLEVLGRSAHSSSPDLGVNAIYAAARVIFGLELLAGQLATDAVLGRGVLAVTDIRSEAVSRNAVPDRCTLVIDRRLVAGESERQAIMEIERILTREGVEAQVRVMEDLVRTHTGVTLTARRSSPPWVFDERHPLVQAMLQAARDVGIRPVCSAWAFATEGAYSAGVAEVPTVGFGPGDPALAHTPDEHVLLEEVYAAAAAYRALAARLLS